MANNETTTKFKVDISELKKSFQEAQRQVRLANSEFKAAVAGMDDWGKSADGISAKLKQLNDVLKAEHDKLNSLEEQYDLTVSEMGEGSKAAQDLKVKINNQKAVIGDVEKQIRNYNTRLGELETASQEAAAEQNRTQTAMEKLSDTVSKQRTELSQLKEKYNDVALEQGASSDEAQELARQIESLSGELQENRNKLKDAESAADDFDQSLEEVEDGTKDADSGFTTLKGTLANLISDGIMFAVGKLKELAADTLEVGKTFDSNMSKVSAISGATGDDLEALREKAKEMGASTQFSATETAEAFEYMGMASWKAQDMISGIGGVLNLAASSGTDLATTSDIVTDSLTALGYSASDAGHFADVMAAASTNANTNVELMGESMKYAGTLAGAMGASVEDVSIALGLMANSGVKGSQAGNALKNALVNLVKPTEQQTDAMKQLGLVTEDGDSAFVKSNGNMKSLGDIMEVLRSTLGKTSVELTDAEGNLKDYDTIISELGDSEEGLTQAEQLKNAAILFGKQNLSGMLAIVNASEEDYNKLSDAIYNCEGTAESMAKTMQDNLGGDITALNSKLEGTKIAIYEKFEPALRAGVDALSGLLDGVNFVVEHSTEFTAALAAMATGVAAYLAYTTALKIMTDGWKSLTIVTKAQAAAQAVLNAVMSLNPIGLVIAAIAALVAAFVILWNKSEGFREFWIGLWDKVKEVASGAWEAISGFFSAAWTQIQEVWSGITEFFSELWESVKAVFAVIADWILENVFQPIMDFFAPVVSFFATSWEIISQLATGCLKLIKIIWKVVSDWFSKNVIVPLKNKFSALWDKISTFASDTWDKIVGIWTAVSEWFNKNVTTPIKGFFSEVWDKLKSGASDAWEGIKKPFLHIADWFHDVFSAAWQRVKDVFSAGGEIFDNIKEGISSALKNVVNWLIDGVNNVIAFPFNKINDMLDNIRDIEIAGFQPFEGLISRFDVPQIPKLAHGGVVTKATNAIIGEDGPEAVVPLKNNTQWIDEVASRVAYRVGARSAMAAGNQNVTNNYNFNQTNNSPKSLSRLEIYRQSKNLLKGVAAV